jgi:5'-methylthioadenosine phosphorylase
MSTPLADVAVIGGSGMYRMFTDAEEYPVDTPYGAPSAPITLGEVAGRRVAFLPRHGVAHEFPPHAVNYRANIRALADLGVRQVLAPCAVGSLSADLGPGSLVVPDQLVDWTRGRVQTFHDEFTGPPLHASFADPYCPVVRRALLAAAAEQTWPAVDGGAMVVIEGPRFSTRAESRFFAAQGWLLVNMTNHPEAVLARELGLCYSPIALVTDLDAGLVEGDGVSVAEVLRVFGLHVERLRSVIAAAVALLPGSAQGHCRPD